jgi:transposase, IS5 family
MHKKQTFTLKNRAAMIRTTRSKQLTIAEFDWPFETALDKNNRWVKLSVCIPWDEPGESYYQGLPGYQATAPFPPSLLVEIRKRMGEAVFEGFHRTIIEALEGQKPVKPAPQAPPDASLRSESDAAPTG